MILDELYYGNIYPSEQILVHDKEYHKLRKHTGVLLAQLEEKLTLEQMELVNQFHSHLIDVNSLEAKANFQYGFSLGLMLMKEAQDMFKQGNL